MFDIVIPIGPNDSSIIKEQIVFTKKKCNRLSKYLSN